MKKLWRHGLIAGVIACGLALSTVPALGQNCTRENPCPDSNHHTTAKIVGGSAVGGALVGGLAGGGKGALIGGAVGRWRSYSGYSSEASEPQQIWNRESE